MPNTHISAFQLHPVHGTALKINTGFTAQGIGMFGPNQPFIFIEHDPTALTEVWQIIPVAAGAAFPDGAQYIGTYPFIQEKKNYIQVAGSPGMTNDPNIEITIVNAYLRPCPLEEVPKEFMEAAA